VTVKEARHRLVDSLDSEDTMEEALDYLLWLTGSCETLTPEELARVEAGEAAIARGEYVTLDAIEQRLRR